MQAFPSRRYGSDLPQENYAAQPDKRRMTVAAHAAQSSGVPHIQGGNALCKIFVEMQHPADMQKLQWAVELAAGREQLTAA